MGLRVEYIFVGYFTGYNSNILLCVSTDINEVEYYLRRVRKLFPDRYAIYQTMLDVDSAHILYEDYMLYDYSDDFKVLTSRDIDTINRDIESIYRRFDNFKSEFEAYLSAMYDSRRFSNDINSFELVSNMINRHMNNIESVSALTVEYLKDSQVISSNINDYLRYMGSIEEDKELTNQFYNKI